MSYRSECLCILYVYINAINGKCYVGQTWRTIEDRAGKNGIQYKRCKKFWRAICKYGWSAFKVQFLIFANTQECADYWEDYFIDKYDSIKNGYNIRNGGSRGKLSPQTIIKLSGRTKFTPVIELQIVDSYLQGNDTSDVGRAFDTPRSTIREILKRHKIIIRPKNTKGKPKPNKNKFKPNVELQIVDYYLQGNNTVVTRKKFGGSKNTICNILKRHKIILRPKDGGKKLKGNYKLTYDQIKAIQIDTRLYSVIAKEYGVATSSISNYKRLKII